LYFLLKLYSLLIAEVLLQADIIWGRYDE